MNSLKTLLIKMTNLVKIKIRTLKINSLPVTRGRRYADSSSIR